MVLNTSQATQIQGPATMDGVGPTNGTENYWKDVDARRRNAAPWRQDAAQA